MTDVKQILLVDDHFEMLELLRSMLELSGHDYEVLAVPSAEEGFLELLRIRFDLLITDVRLPGMSGFDLVRRIRRRLPELPVIMITAYSSAQGQKEAAELGVFRYFPKPLDTDAVLTAVHRVLHGEVVERVTEVREEEAEFVLPSEARKRLESLRADTGAVGLVLSTLQGKILFETGSRRQLDIARIESVIAQNMRNSFLLTDQLGGEEPFTIQYYTGNSVELYCANVGQSFFVTIYFDAESRRGRIGTIWVFAQRAIRDLITLLPAPPAVNQPSLSSTQPPAQQATGGHQSVQQAEPDVVDAPSEIQQKAATSPSPPSRGDADDLIEVLNSVQTQPQEIVDAFWDTVLAQEGTNQMNAIPETLGSGSANMDDLLAVLDLEPTDTEVDLDAFWDEVAAPGSIESVASTLSLEEAQRQGVIEPEVLSFADATRQDPKDVEASADQSPADATTEEKGEQDGGLDNNSLYNEIEDLDSFWNNALLQEETSQPSQAFSYEEALRRGLISPKFDSD